MRNLNLKTVYTRVKEVWNNLIFRDNLYSCQGVFADSLSSYQGAYMNTQIRVFKQEITCQKKKLPPFLTSCTIWMGRPFSALIAMLNSMSWAWVICCCDNVSCALLYVWPKVYDYYFTKLTSNGGVHGCRIQKCRYRTGNLLYILMFEYIHFRSYYLICAIGIGPCLSPPLCFYDCTCEEKSSANYWSDH